MREKKEEQRKETLFISLLKQNVLPSVDAFRYSIRFNWTCLCMDRDENDLE